jgi:hypothetical protein
MSRTELRTHALYSLSQIIIQEKHHLFNSSTNQPGAAVLGVESDEEGKQTKGSYLPPGRTP